MTLTDAKEKLLNAALAHVVFDGWTETCFEAAARDVGLTDAEARAACPRGAVDLAAAYHKRGDQQMLAAFEAADVSGLRYSEKVAELVWLRLKQSDRETVRRGMALFSLPQHAAEGSALIWGTADLIWNTLGDTSDDVNWYSKRAILSGVFGSSVLFWLGDTSEGDSATRAFIDRRIANVMQFEKFKSRVRSNPAFKPLISLGEGLLSGIRAPRSGRDDLPGRWP